MINKQNLSQNYKIANIAWGADAPLMRHDYTLDGTTENHEIFAIHHFFISYTSMLCTTTRA